MEIYFFKRFRYNFENYICGYLENQKIRKLLEIVI